VRGREAGSQSRLYHPYRDSGEGKKETDEFMVINPHLGRLSASDLSAVPLTGTGSGSVPVFVKLTAEVKSEARLKPPGATGYE
jgi:hypothetical protein